MMGNSFWRRTVGLGAALMLLTPTHIATAEPLDISLGKAGDHVSSPEMTTRFASTNKWFVELKSAPTSTGGSQRTIAVQQDRFVSDARAEGLPAQVSRTFSTLFNGFSVEASATTADAYAEMAGVKAVYPVVSVAAPEPQTVILDPPSALRMTGADVTQSELGLTGRGIKVGIIDTGIDYDHPDLGGGGTPGATAFPTAKVRYGHDFVGDAYNDDPTSAAYNPTAKPDGQPDDCNGHGTHVAGIVGSAGKLAGVAPEVTLGAYRVFGCDGSTSTEIILAALERAEADGMDVVNLSISDSLQSWPSYPTSKAADRLVRNGVVVVASAGNDGQYFTQAVGSPSTGSTVISAASYDNVRLINPTGALISAFSSWGLAADLTLKPDLGAPGGSIHSTYPLEMDGYATLSGTSMASGHVAGAAALMLQANPALTPADVLTRMQNTAEPSQFSYLPEAGILDAAHHQGAGMIQVNRAILATTSVAPGKISAGESADGPHTETLTLSNRGIVAATWRLDAENAVSTHVNPTDPEATQNDVEFTDGSATVVFSAASVTVPAGGTATVDVTISPGTMSVAGTQYSGFIHLSSDESSGPISVPFAGMVGDYGALPILPDLGRGLPALVVLTSCTLWEGRACVDPDVEVEEAGANTVYSLGEDLPTVIAHIAQPAARLSVDVLQVSASGGIVESSSRTAYAVDHVGRNPGYSFWTWDGRLADKSGLVREVAPGNYVLRLTALAADGDGATQSWTSPAFGVRNAPAPSSLSPTRPPVDLYATPGYHDVNGRKWFTSCEKYSQTSRCRTNILATQVTERNGRFIARKGWVFNNLTYLPSPRRLWSGNPLGTAGDHTVGSHRWRTECDTPTSGRKGCRSYIRSRVIVSTPKGTGYTYRWKSAWVFNNSVRFS